ncbi:class I SAM-dependent methyltransferase [Nitratireductor sp. ZSWI3]|uniref:class I SAM-dependent methyltransferase n=1 Tax=Nitratireductor sp. ZSWI3 TaxID=2966359 RepID=UPI002150046E|nr:class I SAM-dependent methyltransferase [Nitratireductor sp. ZSWI3]MCR4266990.1 class I SAM-dependent methyltransferase [Nitratireductor sp. ZSWI3]
MSEVVVLRKKKREVMPPVDEERVRWLTQAVLNNRFLPQPGADTVFVGDGDFRSIGAEYLGHFIRLGGLTAESRVLDIGSGIGRMAVPLTQYLDPEKGGYCGIDPVRSGITWCQEAISPVYPNFRFEHLDIAHALYNPKGAISGRTLKLPFPDRQFDFAIMTSVVTHLPPDEVIVYVREVGRLLKPGGRLFMTAFVVDRVAEANENGRRDARLAFRRYRNGPCWLVPELPPLAAVGFDEGFLDRVLAQAGLAVMRKSRGHWRGESAAHYQDVFVAEHRGERR